MKKRYNKKVDVIIGPQFDGKSGRTFKKSRVKAQIGRVTIGNKVGDDSPQSIRKAIKKQLVLLVVFTVVTVVFVIVTTEMRK